MLVAGVLAWGWSVFDIAVLRSAWDYPERLGDFVDWARATSTTTLLLNPLALLEWNSDKRYLADLSAAGVPTVETSFVSPGSPFTLPPDGEFVVKPSVSAGSRHTARFGLGDEARARALIEQIWSSGRTVMVPPYLAAVDTIGEVGLVSFDGAHSHAFNKGPLLRRGDQPTPDLFAAEEIRPERATSEAIEIAAAAVQVAASATGYLPLYARVDVVPGPDGSPLVLELELIEPSMFHEADPASADRFAAAILSRI